MKMTTDCCSAGKTCASHNSRLLRKHCGVGFRDDPHTDVHSETEVAGEEEEMIAELKRQAPSEILDSSVVSAGPCVQ